MDTRDMILICKALSDTNRLEIVQMLSDGEKCGCKILNHHGGAECTGRDTG